jgi:hypothetical protein
MNKTKIYVTLATTGLFLTVGLPTAVAAGGMVEVDLKFAGSLATGVLHADPMTGAPVTSALVHTQARGKPGRAEVRGFGARDSIPEFTLNCRGTDGTFLRIRATENPLVFTFYKDLSLLFAKNGSGEICVDLATGKSVFSFNIEFVGGRGKFAGATGYAVIEGEAEPVSADGSFSGETGTIVGWVYLPHRHKKGGDDH